MSHAGINKGVVWIRKSGIIYLKPFSMCCSSLLQWYNHTDYPIFNQYQRYRRLHPQQPFYILHPRFEWQLWQRIQDNMAEPIQKNPPSSGLLGIGTTSCLATSCLYSVHFDSDMLDKNNFLTPNKCGMKPQHGNRISSSKSDHFWWSKSGLMTFLIFVSLLNWLLQSKEYWSLFSFISCGLCKGKNKVRNHNSNNTTFSVLVQLWWVSGYAHCLSLFFFAVSDFFGSFCFSSFFQNHFWQKKLLGPLF